MGIPGLIVTEEMVPGIQEIESRLALKLKKKVTRIERRL